MSQSQARRVPVHSGRVGTRLCEHGGPAEETQFRRGDDRIFPVAQHSPRPHVSGSPVAFAMSGYCLLGNFECCLINLSRSSIIDHPGHPPEARRVPSPPPLARLSAPRAYHVANSRGPLGKLSATGLTGGERVQLPRASQSCPRSLRPVWLSTPGPLRSSTSFSVTVALP